MKWTFDTVRGIHTLEDSGSRLALIYIGRSSKGARKFKVKTLVSFLYFSPKVQKRLERSRKEWKTLVRKFDTQEEVDRYVDRKKDEVLRFIHAREA